MSYTVKIYINSSGDDYMAKSLSGETSIDCDFKSPVDVENPTIYISATNAYDGYNYCYISEFGRYYYMKCIGGNSQTLTFQCQSDPLMSFAGQIKACPAVIAKNPWHWDLYLPDPDLPVEARSVSGILDFSNKTHFSGSSNCYVLTTLGGLGS